MEFDHFDGRRFEPGVYVLDLTWDGPAGREAGTWHVELLPGATNREPPLLEAARRYATYAGTEQVVVGGPIPGGSEPVPTAVQAFPMGDPIGCDEPLAAPMLAVLGLGHRAGDAPDDVVATFELADGLAMEEALRIAPDAGPGLTLVAPADGAAFAPGPHTFTVTRGGEARSFTVCVGTSAGS